ncbi:hypothetical protein SNOG_16201 [Parastagonospora nodorum SN15]|uniref:Uncharacterized protein n=1 Tax=Phaeosphaeria nodorum (strain SN15 / ATCC MYA-4574 / FGSC 10173) TaxID=321614 RepID=Q0TW80_PHANO|nr:hypothetical protein SNOG_16201 [Parastagonospora nodorum SN15]EAT76385.1 hypothetical protein SNOG_16201 [Parastagonospora nodorum SN15]
MYECLPPFICKGNVFAEPGAILCRKAGSFQPVAAIKQLAAQDVGGDSKSGILSMSAWWRLCTQFALFRGGSMDGESGEGDGLDSKMLRAVPSADSVATPDSE